MLIIILKHFFMKPKKSTKSKVGKIQDNKWYLAHGGEKSQGNVVMYHYYDISMSKQMNFRGMDDSIVSSIWRMSVDML
jgi:hypothetical protein